jgi:predicted NBD/HSP70 family sugar kinase
LGKKTHQSRHQAVMPSDVKPINRMKILDIFRSNGPLSVNDVSEKTGISRLTIKRSITDLLERGLIRSAGKGKSNEGGGPRPELYAFYSEKLNFCLSMEGGILNAAICDQQNNILKQGRLSFESISLENFLGLIDKCWEDFSSECRITKKQIYGVILACNGLVNSEQKILVHRAESSYWGTNIPLGSYLQKRFPDAEILIESSTLMSGIFEIIKEHEFIKGKRIITINTDTGISSCFIDNRNPDGLPTMEVGELGHIMVEPHDEEQCDCGSHGCLEIMVSERRILRLLEEKTRNGKKSCSEDYFSLAVIFQAADREDSVAQELVDYIARMFFYALRNVLTLLRAEVIFFQGVYAHAGEYFFSKLHEYLAEQPYQLRQSIPEIRCDMRSLSEIQLSAVSSVISKHYFEKQKN